MTLRTLGTNVASLNATYPSAVVLSGTGIDLTGATDCTAALQALFVSGLAAGAKRFVGVHGATYKVALGDGVSLATFTNTTGITVDMANSTIDNSGTAYTLDSVSPVFMVDGATDTTILLRRYIGFTLASPTNGTTGLGYRGATLVRAINAAKNTKVHARADNLRYGVQSGEYSDPTKGGCTGFDVKLRGTMIGYPTALYLAENVALDIDVDGIHRASYIAGCDGVRGVIRFKDQYIAPIVFYMTNALLTGTDAAAQAAPVASPTTSRGCSNIDVTVVDKGSTVFQTTSVCVGIGLERVDACRFSNIKVKVHLKGDDTTSTRMGGFHILPGGATTSQTRYLDSTVTALGYGEWRQDIIFDGLKVSGVVDHSASSSAMNATGELYISAVDSNSTRAAAGSYATMRNVDIEDFSILKSSASSPRQVYFLAPGLVTPARISGLYAPGLNMVLRTNTTVATVLDRVTVSDLLADALSGSSRIILGHGTNIDTKSEFNTPATSQTSLQGGRIGSSGPITRVKETTLTLTGASVTWSAAIPGGLPLLGVEGYVTEVITGASGFQVGLSTDTDRFADRAVTAVGSTFTPTSQAVDQTSIVRYVSNTDIVVTAKTANFTAGKLRVRIYYTDFGTPTA